MKKVVLLKNTIMQPGTKVQTKNYDLNFFYSEIICENREKILIDQNVDNPNFDLFEFENIGNEQQTVSFILNFK